MGISVLQKHVKKMERSDRGIFMDVDLKFYHTPHKSEGRAGPRTLNILCLKMKKLYVKARTRKSSQKTGRNGARKLKGVGLKS